MAEIEYRDVGLVTGPLRYRHGPDSLPRSEVVPGACNAFEAHVGGVTHRYRVHVPHGYSADRPAALMVFLDGSLYHAPDGEIRGGLVLDNLVARRAVPMTIGVFVDPVDRNALYDAFDDRYASFLADQIISRVAAGWNIDPSPSAHGICGGSSGGNAAITAAWTRPDVFGKAISFLGSFAQIPEGNPYPHLIRETPPRQLRIFMSAASFDLNHAKAGRLTRVSDTTQGQCTTRNYTFDNRGNRLGASETSQETRTNTNPATSWTYDTADRPLTSGTSSYSYDQLGRQLTIPAVDAPNPNNGDIALGYYDDDSARSITQDGTTLTYGLDTAGRRATQTTTTSGAVTTTVTNHYTDDSDNPGWITTNTGALSTTVYTDQVSDDLSMSIISDEAGTRGELAIVTPRGDVAATITITNPNAVADGIDSWTRYTEYGQPLTPQPAGTTGTAGNGYGWLGAKQRTTTTTGLLLMGARLYNPITGLFTSIDPVFGGNDTPYAYPNDPINKQDTTGEKWSRRKVWDTFTTGLAVASLFGCGVCAAASVAIAAGTMAYHGYKAVRSKGKNRKAALKAVAWEAVGLIPGGGRMLGRGLSRYGQRVVQKSYGKAKSLKSKVKKQRKAGRKMVSRGRQTYARYSSRPYRAYENGITGAGVGSYCYSYCRRQR